MTLTLPTLTALDPAQAGEGSLDPMGTAAIADELVEMFLPGMTARMQRPRFLTAMCVGSFVTQGMEPEIAADGVSAPTMVFEWYVVEALARRAGPDGLDVRALPGIEKARAVLRQDGHLGAGSYLKMPRVFGFFGVYRRLATHLGLMDQDDILLEEGDALVRLWEKEQGLEGFTSQDGHGSDGAKLRGSLGWAIQEGLKMARTNRSAGWQAWHLLARGLAVAGAGSREAARILDLLERDTEGVRGTVLRLLRRPEPRGIWERTQNEGAVLRWLLEQAGSPLAERLQAFQAFERLSRTLQDAWEELLYLGSTADMSGLSARDYARSERATELARRVAADFRRAVEAADAVGKAAAVEIRLGAFGEVTEAEPLFHQLLTHHAWHQEHKPPDGKRPWVESSYGERAVVRPPYRRSEPPKISDDLVHPARFVACFGFLRDLRAA